MRNSSRFKRGLRVPLALNRTFPNLAEALYGRHLDRRDWKPCTMLIRSG